jgi:hypothetical protein
MQTSWYNPAMEKHPGLDLNREKVTVRKCPGWSWENRLQHLLERIKKTSKRNPYLELRVSDFLFDLVDWERREETDREDAAWMLAIQLIDLVKAGLIMDGWKPAPEESSISLEGDVGKGRTTR